MFVDELAHRGDQDQTDQNQGAGKWAYQPAEPNNFSPVVPYVGQRTWLAECGAEAAVAPYAWSKFKHEYFDNVDPQLQIRQVMMDDEHCKS